MTADSSFDSICYRPAGAGDLDDLAGIAGVCHEAHRRFSTHVIEYMATQPSCRVFVAETKSIVGFVAVHKRRGPFGEVVAVDVAPAARRLDVATGLMSCGEAWLTVKGARWIYLEVDAGNRPALGLYTKLGYVPREEFSEDGERHVLMQKLIGGIGPDRLHIRK
jgi:ribosomal-protein-alanine N-acetyltransferase